MDGSGVGGAEPEPKDGSKSVRSAGGAPGVPPGVPPALPVPVEVDAGTDASPDAWAGALDVLEAAVAPPTSPIEPPPLLLSLPLDDIDGSRAARDRSDQQHQVSLHRLNAARCWVDGRRGGALAFARDGYLEVAPRPALAGVNRFSFAAWVRRERADDDGVLISRGVAGAGGYVYRVWISGDRLRIQLNHPGPGGFHETSRSTLPVRRWVHLAVTFDGRRVRLYQDGALGDQWDHDQALASVGPDRPLLIGGSESPGDDEGVRDRLTGRLDDLVIYGDALEPAQVAALAAGRD